MKSLTGKVVLVTGASKGIGAAIARALAEEGAFVLAACRSDRAGAEAALAGFPEQNWRILQADQGDVRAMDTLWDEAMAWRGRIDAVVLNAAIMLTTGGTTDPEEGWEEAWTSQYRVNVLAPARLMRRAVGHFVPRGGGVIVTISSWAAQRGSSNPAMMAYAATKAAVKAAAQTVARGHAKDGVLSYIVAPGVVRTRMSEDFAALQGGGEEKITATLAMGEWVPPEDIGPLVAFLVSGRARHLSGATLDVNGASYIR